MAALEDIHHTELIFISSAGPGVDDVLERNAPAVPWLRRWHKRGAAIASVCSGVGQVAAAGFLDGKRATTHRGTGRTVSREISEGALDAGIDGYGRPRLLLRRGRKCRHGS